MDDATQEKSRPLKGDENANESILLPRFILGRMMFLNDIRPCLEN